tara:strand:+ start:543 stop:1790 length:1248 start_codon:yes stop_codon:yes gene_type:complete
MKEIKLPEIGEGITEVTITDILVTSNQSIKINDIIIIVESEKASMEIPSLDNGKITEIKIAKGDTISPGETLLILDSKKNEATKKDEKEIEKHIEKNQEEFENDTAIKVIKTDKTIELQHASPSVRKLARELGCSLDEIKGSGRNGRITKEDIYSSLKDKTSTSVTTKVKKTDNIFNALSRWGATEKVELNNIKRVTAKRLHSAWVEIPHVTQFDEVDITNLDKIRIELKKINKDPKIKISLIPFFMKTIVKILKEMPIFNSSLSDNRKSLIHRKYFNIGIATDTPRGLVVPVIKNVDQKSLKKLSHELTITTYKAKEKRLSVEDMSGGCITISSLGSLGGKFFTPIINPPEVAILGISKFEIKPKLIDNKFVARKILPISLSYDHRVIDGADAVRFTKLFADIISKPNSLLDGK